MSGKSNSTDGAKVLKDEEESELRNVMDNPFPGVPLIDCAAVVSGIIQDPDIPQWKKEVRVSQLKQTNFPGYKLAQEQGVI